MPTFSPQLLRGQGYYDADVEPRTEKVGDELRVVLTADPGPQYRFASVDLPGLEAAGPDAAKLRDAFAVKPGDPVIAADVIAGGIALTQALGEEGFAERKFGEQDIEVNHQTHLASLTLPVNPGPVARFGAIHVSGRPPFTAHHVAIIARFKRGDPFKHSKLDDLRRALIATTLVADADIRSFRCRAAATVDIDVQLEPAPSHTIAGELGYGTGQGARAEASWTDRNFFNPEGALTRARDRRHQRAACRRPVPPLELPSARPDPEPAGFRFTPEVRCVRRPRRSILAANIERQSNFIWQKKWTWSYGIQFLATDERGVFSSAGIKDTKTFFIAALPLSAGYDGSDNLLDPTRGFRLSGRLSPELSSHGGKFTYARLQLDASAYHPVSDHVVVAGRVRLGTIMGARSSTSLRRAASTRAAAARCAATATSSWDPRTRTAIRSAAAAWPSSGSRRAFGSGSSAAISVSFPSSTAAR